MAPAVCACGEPEGAKYYALKHNLYRDETLPLLIKFRAQVTGVAIDGRDFLYTSFQFGEPVKARLVLPRLFGPKVLYYAERAWASDDQGYRVAICDLATHDCELILAHHQNRTVIHGRHNTLFQSAFQVRLPISAAQIDEVKVVTDSWNSPQVEATLEQLL